MKTDEYPLWDEFLEQEVSQTLLIIGGNRGVGKLLAGILDKDYSVITMSSKDCDVTCLSSLEEVAAKHKPDIVINCAGVNFDGFAHKYSENEIKKSIDVNVEGAVNVARAFIPGMRERQFGRLIYLSSTLAKTALKGTSLYTASKAFIDSFSRTVGMENGSKNVTCNSIQLGYMDAGMALELPETFINDVLKTKVSVGRLGHVSELASLINHIIRIQYQNSSTIVFDGGIA